MDSRGQAAGILFKGCFSSPSKQDVIVIWNRVMAKGMKENNWIGIHIGDRAGKTH